MKILQLKSENVKRLNAVEITPDGDMVIISGENGNGKTSVLDSIEMALGGGNAVCSMPIHKGAKKAGTTIDLGEIIVTRNYTASGTTLTVTTKDGATMKSPQAVLDELVGKLTFDPLAFQRMKADKQLDTLREMAGIDFTMLNARKDRIYSERTDTNRELKRLQGSLSSLPFYKEAPTDEVSIADLQDQLKEANAKAQANQQKRMELEAINDAGKNKAKYIESQKAEIERIKRDLEDRELSLEETVAELHALRIKRDEIKAAVESLQEIDTQEILFEISGSDAINQKVRANRQYKAAESEVKAKETKSAELTKALEEIEEKKLAKIQAASFPVDGLSLDDNGVLFNGIPFEQASGAEQLRVSVAIAMAANPKLKIMLCRDGSLLDKKSLGLLSEIVKENGYQCWLERVGTDDPCAIVIHDGYVKEDAK